FQSGGCRDELVERRADGRKSARGTGRHSLGICWIDVLPSSRERGFGQRFITLPDVAQSRQNAGRLLSDGLPRPIAYRRQWGSHEMSIELHEQCPLDHELEHGERAVCL